MEKLKCKICGFEAFNLEPHINSDHKDQGGLEWYMDKYDAEIEDIIVSKTKTTKITRKVKMDTIKFGEEDLEIQKREMDLIPIKNNGYHFSKDLISDLVLDIKENKKIMLTGHTGSGKSSHIVQLASHIGQGLIRVNLNGQTTIGDFVGLWTVKAGETIWIDGALPKAMREGYWLLVDEIDFGEAAILSVINAILEPNGSLMLKEKGDEVIKPHPDFRIFSTANTAGCMQDFRGMYQGTNIMNEAFLDRWRVYEMKYLPSDIEIKVLEDHDPRITKIIATRVVSVANMIRSAFYNEEITCTFSTRKLLDWTDNMIRHKEPLKAAQATIFNKIPKEDAEAIKGIITRVMVGSNKGTE